jgi:hypothetical protein
MGSPAGSGEGGRESVPFFYCGGFATANFIPTRVVTQS